MPYAALTVLIPCRFAAALHPDRADIMVLLKAFISNPWWMYGYSFNTCFKDLCSLGLFDKLTREEVLELLEHCADRWAGSLLFGAGCL